MGWIFIIYTIAFIFLAWVWADLKNTVHWLDEDIDGVYDDLEKIEERLGKLEGLNNVQVQDNQ